VRTLRGHTCSISDTAIISRGRNVLSGSNDGTIRLWDVSGGQQIRTITAGSGKFSPVLSISLGERGETELGRVRPDGEENPVAAAPTVDEKEVDTTNKVLFCALGDGSFEVFDLGSKRSVFHSKVEDRPAALSSITYSPAHNMLATGSTQGAITVYDTRSLTSPLTSFSRNGASIEDLALATNIKFLSGSPSSTGSDNQVNIAVAAQDGLAFVAGVRPEGPRVLAELAGIDCDGVRAARICAAGDIWTATDDGVVRRY
jgi:proteasomal ATPase-associated factor 1